MKYLLLSSLLLLGCGGGTVHDARNIDLEGIDYIVTGQSNANQPDWSYFESLTGSRIANIAKGGYSIDRLINDDIIFHNAGDQKGIIFIHGETDSISKTDPAYYVERVEFYRKMISSEVGVDLPLYISTVGYYVLMPELDYSFDAIREAVKNEANINPKWIIVYDDARYFRDWGLLNETDGIHFLPAGCELLMDASAVGVYQYQF